MYLVMRILSTVEILDIPVGVKVSIQSRVVTVTGPRGTLVKSLKFAQLEFTHVPASEGVSEHIRVEKWFGNRAERAMVRTATSAISNMIKGVTKGYEYKMRSAFAHYPININLENGDRTVAIRNYLGKKEVFTVDLPVGVTLTRSNDIKDQITLFGNDINLVSQTAAAIQQTTRVCDKDVRKFLDGIYVSEKGTVVKD